MDRWPKLHLLIFWDIFGYLLLLSLFFVPGGAFLLGLVLLRFGKRFEKTLQARPPLETNERRTYFLFTLSIYPVCVGLLLSWLIRHSSLVAWSFGSLGIIVLLTLFYNAYDDIYGSGSRI
ncbi:MAG TPA: hypothetical protein VNQ90_14420 [Chthoniobacteraceae bacterium]|nr:hypothetical protein [Chthoniobacteraceae bacterium]